MSCDRFEHMLPALLDGDLGRDDEAAVQAHLASCASCREVLGELRALEDALLSRRDAVPSSEAFIRGVFAAAAERSADADAVSSARTMLRGVSPSLHRARVIMDVIFSMPGIATLFSLVIGAMCFHYRDVVAAWLGRAISTTPDTGSATSWLQHFFATYAADMTMVFIVYGIATALVVASGAWLTLRFLQDQ